MGGKVWSAEEEECFWTYIVPRSDKRLGVDRANPHKKWEELSKEMQERMGNKARREYTLLGLFEHFFQNAVKERYSPNAARWARAYVRRAKQEGGETLQNDHPPRRQNNKPPAGARSSPLKKPASTPGSQRTPGRRSNHELHEEERGSPRMKAETSPHPSEVELPPFHPPKLAPRPPSRLASDPFESPAPRGNPNNYPAAEGNNWDGDLGASSSVSRRYNSTPASGGYFSSSVPRSQTARLEARIQRTHDTPTRIRRNARSAAPGSAIDPSGARLLGRIQDIIDLDDPFIDSSSPPVPRGNGGLSGYSGQAAHQNLAHHSMMGFPPHPGYHNFGQPPMAGNGQNYTHQSPVNQHAGPNLHGAGGWAPTADMSPPAHPHGLLSHPNGRGIFEGNPDHHAHYTGQGRQQIPARAYTPSFPEYHGSPHNHNHGNGHAAGYNEGTPYRDEEAGHGAGGYRPADRPPENISGRVASPDVFNIQPNQECPASSSSSNDGLPPIAGSDNQGGNASAQQLNSSESSNAGYPTHPAYGGQTSEHGRDADHPDSTHDNHPNGGENAHGQQYSVEGSPHKEQGNTANTSHAGHAGPAGQHINPFADPDADAHGEEDLQAEEPHYQVTNRPIHAPTPRAHRRLKLDENYDDDEAAEGTPF